MLNNSELVSTVKRGGAPASAAVARLLASGAAYPGNASDIKALTNDFSSAAFSYPIAAVAWAYLEVHGIDKYVGDDARIVEIVNAACDGTLFS